MPRDAREKSSTGIYHVVLRGINKQRIFEDNKDYRFFLHRLLKYKGKSDYELYAYCLMSNHVHLLMKERSETIGTAFRRIGASYVYWYNRKYERVGHLFQDRYRSEPVETDAYFLTVIRYIHQNPLKAGLVDDVQTYPWSSYNEYVEKPVICNTEYVLKMFSPKPEKAMILWERFHRQNSADKCLEYDANIRINDSEAVKLIKNVAGVDNPEELKAYEKQKRNGIIKQLKADGLSIRQIERLTGISFAVIRNV